MPKNGLDDTDRCLKDLSMMPPWPGMMSPKSLILKALLKPEAKKPPKGPMMEAKRDMKKVWTKKGKTVMVSFIPRSLLHVAMVWGGRAVTGRQGRRT